MRERWFELNVYVLFDIGIATVITRFENVEKGGGNAGKFENLNFFVEIMDILAWFDESFIGELRWLILKF